MTNSITLITNTGESHKEFLINLLKYSEEIIFAVGFLKDSGLNNIKESLKDHCSDKNKSSTFYIGTGFGETDPNTLMKLLKIINSKKENQLILCTPNAGIFHPKIYLFRTGERVTIVTGSSNLTQHGWVVNDEVSIAIKTTIDSDEYKEIKSYLDQLQEKYYSEDVESIILRYKEEKKKHDKDNWKPQPFRFRRKGSVIYEIDLARLKRYYELYIESEDYIEPTDREERYKKARKNLNALVKDEPLTKKQFHNLFGPLVGHKDYKPKLWHSGSIHRKTYATLKYPKAFREIVRLVKNNKSKPVDKAYDLVISQLNKLRKTKKISGIGENIVTEIFITYNPRKFANLNDNPLTVLSWLGKEFPAPSGFKGEDYADYVNLLSMVMEELEMKTFLEVDSFFNYVYWNLIDE